VLEGISLLSGHHRATTVRRFAGGLITNCPDAFKSGDEAYSGLLDFGEKYHVTSAHFTAIGALSRVVLGWLDPQKKMYRENPIDEQVEVATYFFVCQMD
jgi:hypothetical protein